MPFGYIGLEAPSAGADKSVLLLRRFDREQGNRVPFLSAMSMLDAKDNEPRSYMEFVDVLRQHGAAPKADMHALWRRIVFSIRPRILSIAVDLDDSTASLQLALQVAGYFELDETEAQRIAAQVGAGVTTWRKVGIKLGLTSAEIDRMASAFEHEDLRAALPLQKSA